MVADRKSRFPLCPQFENVTSQSAACQNNQEYHLFPQTRTQGLLREQHKPLENRTDGITTPSKVTPCIISY